MSILFFLLFLFTLLTGRHVWRKSRAAKKPDNSRTVPNSPPLNPDLSPFQQTIPAPTAISSNSELLFAADQEASTTPTNLTSLEEQLDSDDMPDQRDLCQKLMAHILDDSPDQKSFTSAIPVRVNEAFDVDFIDRKDSSWEFLPDDYKTVRLGYSQQFPLDQTKTVPLKVGASLRLIAAHPAYFTAEMDGISSFPIPGDKNTLEKLSWNGQPKLEAQALFFLATLPTHCKKLEVNYGKLKHFSVTDYQSLNRQLLSILRAKKTLGKDFFPALAQATQSEDSPTCAGATLNFIDNIAQAITPGINGLLTKTRQEVVKWAVQHFADPCFNKDDLNTYSPNVHLTNLGLCLATEDTFYNIPSAGYEKEYEYNNSLVNNHLDKTNMLKACAESMKDYFNRHYPQAMKDAIKSTLETVVSKFLTSAEHVLEKFQGSPAAKTASHQKLAAEWADKTSVSLERILPIVQQCADFGVPDTMKTAAINALELDAETTFTMTQELATSYTKLFQTLNAELSKHLPDGASDLMVELDSELYLPTKLHALMPEKNMPELTEKMQEWGLLDAKGMPTTKAFG
jgi:hypothetical protein